MLIEYNGHSNKSGVYKIINLIDGKVYIGSSYSFKARLTQHLSSLGKNVHSNKHLQHAFNLYGTDNFKFEVLEVVDKKEDRFIVEQKYLDIYQNNWEICYNFKKQTIQEERSCFSKTPEDTILKRKMTTLKRYGVEHYSQLPLQRIKISKNLTGIKRTPEEIEKSRLKRIGLKKSQKTIDKLKLAWANNLDRKNKLREFSIKLWEDKEWRKKWSEREIKPTSPETKLKQRNAKLGKKQTPEHITNAAKTRKGRKLPARSKEYKEKMSKSKTGQKHSKKTKIKMSLSKRHKPFLNQPLRPILQFDLDGIFIKEYICIMDAARELNIFNSNIVKCCKGRIKTYKGFIWKYKEVTMEAPNQSNII